MKFPAQQLRSIPRPAALLPLMMAAMMLTACPVEDEPESTGSETQITDAAASGGDGFEPRDGCDPETVGAEDGDVISIYVVENGTLSDVCFGEESDAVEDSWDLLRSFAPDSVLQSVRVLAGFESDPDGEFGTVAFAGPVDEFDNSTFLIAVDVDVAQSDDDELALTLAHEISHVFTNAPDQLDITVSSDECDTYFNGYGCFLEGSYVLSWVDEFWTDEQLDALPLTGQPDEEFGLELCEIDPSILGSYAASHPEEDLAESFAAFVYDVEVSTEAQARVDFFERFPALVVYRDNARQSGRSELANTFGGCG